MADKKINKKRELLKKTGALSGAALTASLLPSSWTKPVVSAIMLPAHAQTSDEVVSAPTTSAPTSTTTSTSSLTSTVTSTFSDSRLKSRIAPIGKSDSGHQLYRFVYIDDLDQVEYIGVMAQDLVSKVDVALHKNANGFFTVDYSKIDVEMHVY